MILRGSPGDTLLTPSSALRHVQHRQLRGWRSAAGLHATFVRFLLRTLLGGDLTLTWRHT